MSNFYQNWIKDKINADIQTKMIAQVLDAFSTKMDSMIEYLQGLNTDIKQIKEGGLQQIKISKVRKATPNIVDPTGYEEDTPISFVPDVDTSGFKLTSKTTTEVKKSTKDLSKMAEKLSEEESK